MTLFLLKLKPGIKCYDYVDGQYVKGTTSYPVKHYTSDKSKARLFRTRISALLSANNGFSLKIQNGQQYYNVIEVEVN